jgi:hypothetical protein
MKVSAWGFCAIFPANGTAYSAYAPLDEWRGLELNLALTDEGVPVAHSRRLEAYQKLPGAGFRPAHLIDCDHTRRTKT